MKKFLIILLLFPITLYAQNPKFTYAEEFKPFKHMGIGANLGTTGLGVEISTPINEHINIRAGFSIVPKISNVSTYSMATVDGENTELDMEYKTDHLVKEYLRYLVNDSTLDNKVAMDRQIGFLNCKLLVDWYPFHNKDWYFTAGIYYGTKSIGRVVNTQDESTTMLAMNLYNKYYDQVLTLDEYEYPYFIAGKFSFEMDGASGEYIKHAFKSYGRMAVQLGSYPDGTPHYVAPAVNGTLSAEATTNALKPYVGAGYNRSIGYDKRWNLGFDVGLLVWGRPHVWVNHYDDTMPEGLENPKKNSTDNHYRVCLVHDVKGVGGIAGKYLNAIKYFPVYPVLEVRLVYTIY